MRFSQIRRHLTPLSLFQKGTPEHLMKAAPSSSTLFGVYQSEFSPRDYVSFLLHVDAEIEHGLMVQYLYAGYSLGGPQVPEQHRETVRGWQEVILGIAKEEMGHLITVQNVLRLMGAPLNLGREDYPWDVPFYPFPFMLEPLTLDSLAKYVYAESPENWTGPLADEIKARVNLATPTPHRVSELFALLLALLQDPDYLPDSTFQADTYPYQADWNEWGRGYQGGARGNSTGKNPPASPDVLVVPVACRDDAVNALTQIAQQGEATTYLEEDGEPSHFTRFLKIYKEMKALAPEGWSASRPVAINPTVSSTGDEDPADGGGLNTAYTPITNPVARLWAQLSNLRYRMLLTYLVHTFNLAGGLEASGTRTPRGAIINATFGEMYNLRALANILMQTPVSFKDEASGLCAGPPFQMPYTLDMPIGEANKWRLHLDLLDAAKPLIAALLAAAPASYHAYLISMREADQQMAEIATRIISSHINRALT